MRLAVIPARGGSKRIPRKNIKDFCGKPIIAYSIDAALASGCFDHVIVSTDDNEISEIAKKYGAKTPFIRPPELSDDFATTPSVIKHAIEWFESYGISFKEVCCLYATAPFTQATSLEHSLIQLQASGADFCFSVAAFPYPIQRALGLNSSGRIKMFAESNILVRSQDLEEAYHDAGQFYWGTIDAWKKSLSVFSESSCAYVLPKYLVQDIDTIEDWTRAELMFQLLKKQGYV